MKTPYKFIYIWTKSDFLLDKNSPIISHNSSTRESLRRNEGENFSHNQGSKEIEMGRYNRIVLGKVYKQIMINISHIIGAQTKLESEKKYQVY